MQMALDRFDGQCGSPPPPPRPPPPSKRLTATQHRPDVHRKKEKNLFRLCWSSSFSAINVGCNSAPSPGGNRHFVTPPPPFGGDIGGRRSQGGRKVLILGANLQGLALFVAQFARFAVQFVSPFCCPGTSRLYECRGLLYTPPSLVPGGGGHFELSSFMFAASHIPFTVHRQSLWTKL